MDNLIFYFVVFGLILLFLKKGEFTNNKTYIICGYILLFLLSALRYDIGNDYSGYWFYTDILGRDFQATHSIRKVMEYSNNRFEIGFCALACLFSFSDIAFFWIACVFSIIVVTSLYITFSEYKCHFWGTLLVIITGYLFLQWDGVRQSGALALILLSFIYAEKKNLKMFVLCIGIAALCHKSAIFMLLAYPLQYLKMNNKLLYSLLLIGIIIYWSGILDGVVQKVSIWFSLIDGYDKYDNGNVALSIHTTFFSRIRVSLFVLLGALVIAKLDNRYDYFKNCLAIGLFIYMLGGNSLVITRIAWYFMVLLFPCLGLCMKSKLQKSAISQLIKVLVIIQLFVFSYDITTDTNTRGCVPYKSVFSDDFANHQFDVRDYK